MEFDQLKAFVRVAASGSFTRVSQELHISQPAVSSQIRALELELEVRLLERHPRRVVLTPAGEVLLSYAHRLLNLEAECITRVAEVRGQEETSVHLGASPTIGDYILPDLLRRFKNLQPDVQIRADIAPTYQVVRDIQDHAYSLGLIEAQVDENGLELVPFMQDEMVLVLPNGHPWAGRTEVLPGELAKARWILREPGSGTRLWMEEVLRGAGVVLTPEYELGGIEAIKHAVARGMGISLLSLNAVQQEADNGTLAYTRIRGVSLTRPYYAIYERQRYLAPVVKALLDFLTSLAADTINIEPLANS
ncbi:MAG: LysR family transcriptional regulator [Anaerolineae bacterium]